MLKVLLEIREELATIKREHSERFDRLEAEFLSFRYRHTGLHLDFDQMRADLKDLRSRVVALELRQSRTE